MDDNGWMARALELAARGRGAVEPNPMVGAVVVAGGECVGEGWHQKYGGPHAEVHALAEAAERARGATLYVTLEPCCHHGKTPPCTDAVLRAGVTRVVAAMADPFPKVAGQGAAQLRTAGVAVEFGLRESEARRLNAPYLKLLATGRPWVIAKWAMTLDGKIASHTGDSKWISSPESRALVHELRGRVDAVVVGAGTVRADDPLLTARPPGPRVAARVVVSESGNLRPDRQLVQTAREVPVILFTACPDSDETRAWTEAGCEVRACRSNESTGLGFVTQAMDELGRRRMTNVLVEGGGDLLDSLFRESLIDEVWAFVAPKILGGIDAIGPVGGSGVAKIADAVRLDDLQFQAVGGDCLVRGLVSRRPAVDTQPR